MPLSKNTNWMCFFNLLLGSFLCFGQGELKGTIVSSVTGVKPGSEVTLEFFDGSIYEYNNKVILFINDSTFSIKNLKLDKSYTVRLKSFGYDEQVFEIVMDADYKEVILSLELECEFTREQADLDWANGQGKLLLIGSIVSLANSNKDDRFERKYGITYYDFGCTPPAFECVEQYNKRIIELLDAKFGTARRDKVRKDVEFME